MRITKEDIIKYCRYATGKTKNEVVEFITAYETMLVEIILNGDTVKIDGIGVLGTGVKSAKPERTVWSHFSNEQIIIPASKEFNKPKLKFCPALKQALKEATYGNLF